MICSVDLLTAFSCVVLTSILNVLYLQFIDVLTSFLSEINTAGPTASEFLTLYQSMIDTPPWKQYLTLKGVLMFLADLFNHEIQTLYHLEQTTLTSDLAQGLNIYCAIKYQSQTRVIRKGKINVVNAVSSVLDNMVFTIETVCSLITSQELLKYIS